MKVRGGRARVWLVLMASVAYGATVSVACGSRTSIDVAQPPADRDGAPADVSVDAADVRADTPDARDVISEDAPGVVGKPCATDRDCEDGIACTHESCVDARCRTTADDSLCPVSFACEIGLGCQARAWVTGGVLRRSEHRLYDVRLPSGRIAQEFEIDRDGSDIALDPAGPLVLASWNNLYRLERTGDTWSLTAIGAPFAGDFQFISALDYGGRSLYAGRVGDLVRLDLASQSATDVLPYPAGYTSSGDIAVLGGDVVVATAFAEDDPKDSLVEFDLVSKKVRVLGNVGFGCVHGLAIKGNALYGFTCFGEVLTIDPQTGKGTLVTKHTGVAFSGATAR